MKKYNFVVFADSDGTLRNSNLQVSERTRRIISELEDMGVAVVICTGRPRFQNRKISSSCSASKYMVSSNGADVYDAYNEKSISAIGISDDIIREFYNSANSNNFKLLIGTGDVEFCNIAELNTATQVFLKDGIDSIRGKNIFQCHFSIQGIDKENESWKTDAIEEIKEFIDFADNDKEFEVLLKKMGINGFEELVSLGEEKLIGVIRLIRFYRLKCFLNSILSKYGQQLSIGNLAPEFTDYKETSENPWFTITSKNISKAFGVRKICEYLDVPLSHTVGIGDGYNDRELLASTNISVCMGNGSEEQKKTADIVTKSNDEDGAAIVLEQLKNMLRGRLNIHSLRDIIVDR